MNVPIDELVTLRDWLRWAVTRFGEAGLVFGHGTDNAYDEAAYLLLHALHLPLDRLDPFLDARLARSEREAVAALLARRIDERIPSAYLTREAWLGEFRFYVDERVLIPRSFIAELVPEGLAPLVDLAAVREALDLCTGSGCLAILLAHACPQAEVDAVDVSSEALAVAQRNVSDYGLADRVNLIRSDFFGNLPEEKRYDLIVSNPPYVTSVAMGELPPEYRHEPALGLAAGDDGMDAVRVIVRDAPRFLHPGGLLVVEVGHNRAQAEAAFPRLPFLWLETGSSSDSVFAVRREDLVASR